MKHIGTIAAAALTSGALAFAAVPVAGAQVAGESHTVTLSQECAATIAAGDEILLVDQFGASKATATATITGEGTTAAVTATFDLPASLEAGDYTVTTLKSVNTATPLRCATVTVAAAEGADGSGDNLSSGGFGSSNNGGAEGEGEAPNPDAPAADPNNPNPDVPAADQDGLSSGDIDISSIAGIALPALLVIGGITWFLNQDGSTYVSSEDRVDATPTDEEKQASDDMLANNAEEVAAQAEAAAAAGNAAQGNTQQATDAAATGTDATGATDAAAAGTDGRGIGANTGNNTVAVGLYALVMAALIGAAAFAVRRGFFA